MPENSHSPALGGSPATRANGSWRVSSPYAQAAWTYVRRPFSSPQAWVGSLSVLLMGAFFLMNLLGGNRRDIAAAPIQMPLMFAMALFVMFVVHVKGQFADSRAHLMPGFRRVHATVAAAVALLLAVVLPMVVIWLANLRSVGLVALMVFLLGAILCAVALRSNVLSWGLILGFYASFVEPVKSLLWQLLSGQFEAHALALLALGVALAVVGGARLVGLTEDMPEYLWATRGGTENGAASQRRAGVWKLLRAWEERQEEKRMARWTSHARRASTSWWSRICRWQAGTLFRASRLAAVCVLFLLPSIVFKQDLRSATTAYPFAMVGLSMSSGMFWVAFRRWRTPMLAREVLLPVERRSFVRQLGAAAAVIQIELWACLSVGIALWGLLVAQPTMSLATLAGLLGVFTLLQVWFFGVGIWFVRYRSLGAQLAGFMLAMFVALIAVGFFARTEPWNAWRYAGVAITGLAALFGLLLTCFAYRRWLVEDFD